MTVLERGHTRSNTQYFVLEHCCNCGVPFYMTQEFQKDRIRRGLSFYCPAGHGQHYNGSDQKKIKQLERQLESSRSNERFQQSQRRQAERSAAAVKGHLTRQKNRIKNGVCPCCNRTFVNLGRHIRGQHPEFGKKS